MEAAWAWFVRRAPALTDGEREVYVGALSVAGRWLDRGQPARGAERMDGLRRFVSEVIAPRLRLCHPDTVDTHGRTAWERKRTPLDAVDAFDIGVPMRTAIPKEGRHAQA